MTHTFSYISPPPQLPIYAHVQKLGDGEGGVGLELLFRYNQKIEK